ncbi:MAG: hypothetical protein ACYCZN_15020 [Candidatus Dormibacteria bacterium]
MSSSVKHFLLVFNHQQGKLVEVVEFGDDSEAAVLAYAAKERELQGDTALEVVLIGSDSLETVRRTHANYFQGPAASVEKYLAGV